MATKNGTKVDDNDNEDEMVPNAETAIADKGKLPELNDIITKKRWNLIKGGSAKHKTDIYLTPTCEIIKIAILDEKREPKIKARVKGEQEMLAWIAKGIEEKTDDMFNYFSAGASIPDFEDIIKQTYDLKDRGQAMIVPQENCSMTLLEKIGSMEAPFSEKLARTFWRQLVNALDWLHKQGRAHRDLKLDNICIMRSGRIKLIDFGHAVKFCEDAAGATKVPSSSPTINKSRSADVGTPSYKAPELCPGTTEKDTATPYDPRKVDVWAAGCTLITMVTNKFAFHEDELPPVGEISVDQTGLQKAIGMLRTIDSAIVDKIVKNHTHPYLQAVYFMYKFDGFPQANKALDILYDSFHPVDCRSMSSYILYVTVLVGDWDMYWNLRIGQQRAARLSSELKDLVARMLDPNPDTRPTFADIQNDAWTTNTDVYSLPAAVACMIRRNERHGETATHALRSVATTRSLKTSRGMLVPAKPFHLPDGVESIGENDLIESHIALPYSCDVAKCWTSALKAVDILGRKLYGARSFRFLSGGPAHADCFNALISFTVNDGPVVVRIRCVSMKSERKLCVILFRRVYGSALEFCSFLAKAEEAITGTKSFSSRVTKEKEGDLDGGSLFRASRPVPSSSVDDTGSRSLRRSS